MPEKITIFEPHFHDTQFGPTVTQSDESDDTTEEAAAPSSEASDDSGGKLKYLLAVVAVAIVGAAVYRKLNGDESYEIEVEELETESPASTE